MERHFLHTSSVYLYENVSRFQTPPPPIHLKTSRIHYMPGCRASGSLGFLISPSVSYLFEAPSEGQNQIHPNEKAIVDLFLHLVPPYSFSSRKHLSFFALPEACETIRAHLCPEENSPAVSKAVLFSTRP